MTTKPTLTSIQDEIDQLLGQRSELDQKLLEVRKKLQTARGTMVKTIERTLRAHQPSMQREIAQTLEQLGVQSKITLTMVFDGTTSQLVLTGLDLGGGLGVPLPTEEILTKRHWDLINGCNWNPKQTRLLARYKKNGNALSLAEDINESMVRGAVNALFKQRNLPFRICSPDKPSGGPSSRGKRYKIYIVA
jgi:hypothetical protein